jgi:16S rRNA (cytosine1402-N4)-methyltransferase
VAKVDGVLADLGVSSPQLDEAERGFSFRFDAPLDMRMDQSQGETVADWLARADEQDIAEVIWRYGEERFARQIARKIIAARSGGGIRSTSELAKLVGETVRTREPGHNPATRTFQALRIFINKELEEIETMLPQAVECLKVGGKLVVISFHSLEDRIVKRYMQNAARRDSLPSNFPIRANEINEARLTLVGRAIKASDAEINVNPRARSAVMRVAERTAVGQ